MKKIFLLLTLFCIATISAQENKKNLIAKRVMNPPKIDGILNDAVWKDVDVAKDFVMFRPSSGKPEAKPVRELQLIIRST